MSLASYFMDHKQKVSSQLFSQTQMLVNHLKIQVLILGINTEMLNN